MDEYQPPKPTFVTGRYPKIYWTENGANINGIYTKKEFLRKATIAMLQQGYLYLRRKGDPVGYIPEGQVKKKDMEGYMRMLGAEWIYPKTTQSHHSPK